MYVVFTVYAGHTVVYPVVHTSKLICHVISKLGGVIDVLVDLLADRLIKQFIDGLTMNHYERAITIITIKSLVLLLRIRHWQ